MFKRLAVLLAFLAPLLGNAAGPSFVLTDIGGKQHALADYRGKWVLVNLWATWCTPCLAEMPELEALSKSRNDVVVLGLAVDGQNPARVKQFAEKLHVSYPIIAGDTDMAKQFKPRGYPTSILYNPAGEAAFVKEGQTTRHEMEEALQRYKVHQ